MPGLPQLYDTQTDTGYRPQRGQAGARVRRRKKRNPNKTPKVSDFVKQPGMEANSDGNMGFSYPRAQITPTPVTTQETPAATPARPKLSAYEKRRQGILDILNDPQFSSYNEAYIPNYDIARGQIENAYAQAIGEIQSRQAAGEGLISQMPGQIDANYGGAAQTIDQQAQAARTAQNNSGLRSFGDEQTYMAPVKGALAMEQAGAKSQVPTLGVGLSNLVSQQRQDVGNTRASALADIAQQEEEARAAALERQQEQENSDREWGRNQLWDAEMADEQEQKDKNGKRYSDYAWGADVLSGQKGEAVANTLPRLTSRYRSGQGPKRGQAAYDYVRSQIRGLAGMGPNKQKRELARILKHAREKWGGNDKAISLAIYEVMGS